MTQYAENQVIAHFVGGRLVKGTTLDFHQTKRRFHITDADGKVHEIDMQALKAVFFVKDFKGDASYNERKGFFHPDTRQGKKVMVEFHDGEVLFGHTLSYTSKGIGFFMFPGDPDCNNIKIFVIHESAKRVKVKSLPEMSAP